MKTLLHSVLGSVATVLVLGSTGAVAQDFLPREQAMRYALVAALHEPPAAQLPIKVDADLKRPVAGYDGDYGVLVLPETKLSAATFEALSHEVVPIGQIWLRRLAPMVQGAAVDASRLLMVPVRHEGESDRVPLCLLGARKTAGGGVELVVYGKGSEPLARVELRKQPRTQSLPIEVSAERDYDSGRLTLHLVGQYAATLSVTELSE